MKIEVIKNSNLCAEIIRKFYHFSQNNSGGSFRVCEEDGIGTDVIIEAFGSDHANQRALEIGLYFDGVHEGRDCDCCGDRWYQVGEGDAEEYPHVYGNPLEACNQNWYRQIVYVHYLDGTVTKVTLSE